MFTLNKSIFRIRYNVNKLDLVDLFIDLWCKHSKGRGSVVRQSRNALRRFTEQTEDMEEINKWKKVEGRSGTGYGIVTINDRIVLSLEITLILSVGLTKVYPFKNCSLHIYERSFRCNHTDVARNLTEEKQRLMPLIIAFPYINGRIHPRDWTEIWQTANVRSRYRSIPT